MAWSLEYSLSADAKFSNWTLMRFLYKPVTLKAAAAGAVLRYKWTLNGEAISGVSNGELVVSRRKTGASDVYAVTPVYSVGGAEIEGAAVSATVDYLPLGLTIIVR